MAQVKPAAKVTAEAEVAVVVEEIQLFFASLIAAVAVAAVALVVAAVAAVQAAPAAEIALPSCFLTPS